MSSSCKSTTTTRRQSSLAALTTLLFLWLLTGPALAAEDSRPTLLVLGDSLSAAYGIPSEDSWVNLLRQRLARHPDNWRLVNASISGETTDGGLRRLPGLLQTHQPEILIIELGGNDGLRGFPPSVTRENLTQMVRLGQQAGARVLLVGMRIPPNYGPGYTQAFADIFPQVANEQGATLVPFFLDGVYDSPGMMQEDGIHPTAKAQPQLLDTLWPHLKPLLQERQHSGQ